MARISVIVPVYNCDKYLSQCLDSIVKQSFSDYELILVDDGSRDNSGVICDLYAKNDSRIRVFHKENGGVSSARNIGLDMCVGDYVSFIDSDDYIAVDYLEKLINSIEKYDCISTGYHRVGNEDERIIQTIPLKRAGYESHEIIVTQYSEDSLFRKAFFGPWAKLYRTECAKKIRFDIDLKSGEDIVYNLYFLATCQCVKTDDYVGYYLRDNLDSTTHRSTTYYSPRAEHSYTLIDEKIDIAERDLGLSQEWVLHARTFKAPMRYFYELINPFCPGTPYNRKEAYNVIKTINNDKVFLSKVRSVPLRSLPTAYRFAKICSYIKITFLVAFFAKAMLLYISRRTNASK